MNGTSWANLKMMMAVIPSSKKYSKSDDHPDDHQSNISETQNSLEKAGF